MLDTLPGSSEERILVEALTGLEILEGLVVQTREELEAHSDIVNLRCGGRFLIYLFHEYSSRTTTSPTWWYIHLCLQNRVVVQIQI